MTSINKGDALGDCPECGSSNAVIYRGDNEAVCKDCGLVCEVEMEAGEQEAAAPAPEIAAEVAPEQPAAPAPQPAPQAETPAPHVPNVVEPTLPLPGTTEAPSSFATPPVQQKPEPTLGTNEAQHAPPKVVIEGVGQLTDVVGQPIKMRDRLELKEPVSKQAAEALGIPSYVQKSRPWRWAHEMQMNGNPYRNGTKSYEIYHMISHGPTNVWQLVRNLYEQKPDVCDRMNILLTIYEVLTQCIAAGLLVMNEQTGIVQVCQGPPQPRKMP